MDVDNVLGMDGCISMDSCTLHRHILYRIMLMGRGILPTQPMAAIIKFMSLLMHLTLSFYLCHNVIQLHFRSHIKGYHESTNKMSMVMFE